MFEFHLFSRLKCLTLNSPNKEKLRKRKKIWWMREISWSTKWAEAWLFSLTFKNSLHFGNHLSCCVSYLCIRRTSIPLRSARACKISRALYRHSLWRQPVLYFRRDNSSKCCEQLRVFFLGPLTARFLCEGPKQHLPFICVAKQWKGNLGLVMLSVCTSASAKCNLLSCLFLFLCRT